MKTIDEILGKIDPMTLANSPHREGISVKHAKQAMDEYAEEYAQEIIGYFKKNGFPNGVPTKDMIKEFKKYLKE